MFATRSVRWLGSAAAVIGLVLATSVVTANAEEEPPPRPAVCNQLRGEITTITPLAPGQVEVTGSILPGWSDSPSCNTKAYLWAFTGWRTDEGWYKDAYKGNAGVHPQVDNGGKFTTRLTIQWGNYAVCLHDTHNNPIECWEVLVPGQRDENGDYQPTMPIVRGWIPSWLGAKQPDMTDGTPQPECGHCI